MGEIRLAQFIKCLLPLPPGIFLTVMKDYAQGSAVLNMWKTSHANVSSEEAVCRFCSPPRRLLRAGSQIYEKFGCKTLAELGRAVQTNGGLRKRTYFILSL